MISKTTAKRAFFNLGMLISILIQLAYIGYTLYMNALFKEPSNYGILESYTIMLGLSGFIYFTPIYAMLPFSFSYLNERDSGYIYYMIGRMGRKKYILQKIIWTGLSGGFASVFPMFICFLYFSLTMHPSVNDTTSLFYPYMFSDMNLMPYVFVWGGRFILFVELLLIFLFGIFWAEAALLISLIVKNKYITFVLPPGLYLTTWLLSPPSPLYFLQWLYLYRCDYGEEYPLFFGHIIQSINIVVIIIVLIIVFRKQLNPDGQQKKERRHIRKYV